MFKLPPFQLLLIAAFLFTPYSSPEKKITVTDIRLLKTSAAVSCTPDRDQLGLILKEQEIMLLPGSGSYVWKIATDNDSAQQYFNQGINTYYGFHIIEAIASFKKAAQFDAGNPMVWWGQALAYGPNINDVGYSASPEALAAVQKALSLIDKANPVEKALIKAMEVRYSEDTTQTREVLNQRYADEMKAAYLAFPKSPDVLALYADAMMLQHPWDLWEVSGSPKAWTPLIRKVLEEGLSITKKHPGLHHYYIHVMEPSPVPGKALASAEMLGSITPGLAHLVHVPSHIYLRTGQFNKGASINQDAVNQFRKYNELFPAVEGGAFIYYLHNQHMLVNCAMHAGKYPTAIAAANELHGAIDTATLATPPPMGSLVQYIYMTPVLIHTRFEQWDSLLAMPKPANDLVYANIIYEFGQGMAKTGMNDVAAAKQHVQKIDEWMKDENLKIEMTPFSAAYEGAKTARELLLGSIHLREQDYEKAIQHLIIAAETEMNMVYNEPRDWFLNPHQYLATAYMEAGQLAKAEEAYNKDLSINANNVWSLRGLKQVYQKQNNKKKSRQTSKLLVEMEAGDIKR